MSRKGNKLINIPSNVEVTINKNDVIVKGPLGQLKVDYPQEVISLEKVDNNIKVNRKNDEKQSRMYHGTINANITNAIIGVSKGFKKTLKIVGVGYKAAVSGNKLVLAMGFSHPVEFIIPAGLKVVCPIPTAIEISGHDKIVVGEFTAVVRAVRKPEPYKGKGIMYDTEHIIRKVGKTAEGSKK